MRALMAMARQRAGRSAWRSMAQRGATRRGFTAAAAGDLLSVQQVRGRARGLGEAAAVQGWVKSVRRQKKVSFVEVGDGSCWNNLQVVLPTAQLDERVTTGASVRASGKVGQARDGSYELACESLDVVGPCLDDFPIQKKYHSPEFLRELPHLRPRARRQGAVLRVRSSAAQAVHRFFEEDGFFQVDAPVLTSIDAEGAGEMFVLQDPFEQDEEVLHYLSVSGQLHAEIFASALSKVYTFGPAFRAENCNTTRHLNEFYMLEPEVAWCDLDGAMDLAERCVKSVTRRVMDVRGDDLDHLFASGADEEQQAARGVMLEDLRTAESEPFVHMTYDECIDVLLNSRENFTIPVKRGLSLQTEHERYIAETHCGRRPVFVRNYPTRVKAFYMKQVADDPDRVACFDLLFPRLGEMIGGSEREDDVGRLESRLREFNEDAVASLQWYVDLRRYGSVPHAGWGLGFERLVQFLSATENIREAIPVPRTPHSFNL